MNLYIYRAKIIKVYDGDTVTAEIDLGFNVKVIEKIRLLGINAPEIRGGERVAGLASRDFLRSKILDKEVIIETFRDRKGKYGRYLGTIYLTEEENSVNINELLMESGHAKEY